MNLRKKIACYRAIVGLAVLLPQCFIIFIRLKNESAHCRVISMHIHRFPLPMSQKRPVHCQHDTFCYEDYTTLNYSKCL